MRLWKWITDPEVGTKWLLVQNREINLILRKSWLQDYNFISAYDLRSVTLLSGPLKLFRALFLLIRLSFSEQGQFYNAASVIPALLPQPLIPWKCTRAPSLSLPLSWWVPAFSGRVFKERHLVSSLPELVDSWTGWRPFALLAWQKSVLTKYQLSLSVGDQLILLIQSS